MLQMIFVYNNVVVVLFRSPRCTGGALLLLFSANTETSGKRVNHMSPLPMVSLALSVSLSSDPSQQELRFSFKNDESNSADLSSFVSGVLQSNELKLGTWVNGGVLAMFALAPHISVSADSSTIDLNGTSSSSCCCSGRRSIFNCCITVTPTAFRPLRFFRNFATWSPHLCS